MLFVANTADPATPLSAAIRMAKSFTNDSSSLLIQNGYAHLSLDALARSLTPPSPAPQLRPLLSRPPVSLHGQGCARLPPGQRGSRVRHDLRIGSGVLVPRPQGVGFGDGRGGGGCEAVERTAGTGGGEGGEEESGIVVTVDVRGLGDFVQGEEWAKPSRSLGAALRAM